MIKINQKGNFRKTIKYLEKSPKVIENMDFDIYGIKGVNLLRNATPKDTGKTSESWSYDISKKNGTVTISFHNSNIVNGIPIAILLQYGHATKNGGWVEGIDYINPALKPLFQDLAEEAWKEVIKV